MSLLNFLRYDVMAIISFTIPDEKLQRIVNALAGLHKIPEIPDPDWVDPGGGESPPTLPEFTKAQWAKEAVRRWVIHEVWQWERNKAIETVKGAVIMDDMLLE